MGIGEGTDTDKEVGHSENPVLLVNERVLSLMVVLLDSFAATIVNELETKNKGYANRVQELTNSFLIIRNLWQSP